jgi:hypothetical protein
MTKDFFKLVETFARLTADKILGPLSPDSPGALLKERNLFLARTKLQMVGRIQTASQIPDGASFITHVPPL